MIDITGDVTARQRVLGLTAAYACVVGCTAALGLTLPLLPLAMEAEGYSSFFIGLNGAAGAAALLIAAPLIPALADRAGTLNLLVACFAISAICLAAIPWTPVWMWFVLRFVLNFALQGLFVVSEVWINTLATERTRGRLIGLYGALATAGFAAGPAIASVFAVGSSIPFYMGALVILAGLVPVVAARTLVPRMEHTSMRGMFVVVGLAVVPIAAAFAHAVAETATTSFLPLFAVREGWDQSSAILLLTAFGLGNVLLQIPIGWLADKMDRRLMLAICALIGAIGGVILPFIAGSPILLIGLSFLWGGAIIGIYTIGLTLVGQIFTGARLAAASAAFAFAYALGSIIGPSSAGLAMDLTGQAGLGFFIAAVCSLYFIAAFLARRA
jgi:MFS family permease